MTGKRRTSLENAFEILKMFSLNEPEMSVTEVANRLHVSKSTAHRLLSSLLAEGFVYQNPTNQLYSLGSSILSLVNIVNSQIHISSESLPILNTIAERTRENAHLSIKEDATTIVYIQSVKGEYAEERNDPVQLGARKEMKNSASGRIFIAYDKELQEEHNWQDKQVNQIKTDGHIIVESGDITEIAVPVFYKGNITAAISITAKTNRIRPERMRRRALLHLEQGAEKLENIIANRKKGDRIARSS